MGLIWKPDYLGDGFTCAELDVGADDEGPCVATLVSYSTPGEPVESTDSVDPTSPPAPLVRWWSRLRDHLRQDRTEVSEEPAVISAVLYVHGWSDYFMHRELARFYTDRGVAFYAIDLRKYGRSLRSWQTPGYISDLSDYETDLDEALAALESHVRERNGAETRVEVHLMAHSTGGLIASLWANHRRGRIASLILNSPWLDMQGSALLRGATRLDPVTRFRPKAKVLLPDIGLYWRSISDAADGEWTLHEQWRPQFGFPIRAGWVAAVLAGHAQVRKGLDVGVPVLVLASARSTVSPVWSETMLTTDSVLDVTLMTQRALQLGDTVTVRRFDGALHDVLLSREPVRRQVYQALEQWLHCSRA